jgi:hypothetical protein
MDGITTVNFGREYVMFLPRIQVNGGNSEYLKVISEPFAQSWGRIRQLEVAKAILRESRYTFSTGSGRLGGSPGCFASECRWQDG